MRTISKMAIAAGSIAMVAAMIVTYRTANFAPEGITDAAGAPIYDVPPYDIGVAADHLAQAVRFKTVSHQDAAENDISQWADLHSWLEITYPAAHGAMTREFVAERTLVYKWGGTDETQKPIILMAHQDVVPVTEGTEQDWTHPPFDGVIAEGSIWGRGTVDDKGSLIALFEAVDVMARNGFKPKRSIYIVSGHDEEVGGSGARAAAAFLAARGVKALFTLDEGSAVVTDAPILEGTAALIGIAEKGYATLKVTANDIGGHSSMPPKETGVINLSKAVLAINENAFPLKIEGPGGQMLETLAAAKGGTIKMAIANQWLFGPQIKGQISKTPSGAALMHTTIAPTMLQGSPKENVLPQSANALINYRIAPWDRSEDIMAKAKEAVGDLPVTLEWVAPPREPSKISSTNSEGWKLVAGAAQQSAPEALITPYLVVAGTDGRSMQDISDDVYRFMPTYFSLNETAMIHGTSEHMTIANLKRVINFYTQLISASAG